MEILKLLNKNRLKIITLIFILSTIFSSCCTNNVIEVSMSPILNDDLILTLIKNYSLGSENQDYTYKFQKTDLIKITNNLEILVQVSIDNMYNYLECIETEKNYTYVYPFFDEKNELCFNSKESFVYSYFPEHKNAFKDGEFVGYYKCPYLNFENELYLLSNHYSYYKIFGEAIKEHNEYFLFDTEKYDYHLNYLISVFSKLK